MMNKLFTNWSHTENGSLTTCTWCFWQFPTFENQIKCLKITFCNKTNLLKCSKIIQREINYQTPLNKLPK